MMSIASQVLSDVQAIGRALGAFAHPSMLRLLDETQTRLGTPSEIKC